MFQVSDLIVDSSSNAIRVLSAFESYAHDPKVVG